MATQETAQQAYDRNVQQLQALYVQLGSYVLGTNGKTVMNNDLTVGPINWSHVGSAAHVVEQLQEVIKFIEG